MSEPIHKRPSIDCFESVFNQCWRQITPERLWKPFSARVDLLYVETEAYHFTGSKSPPVPQKTQPENFGPVNFRYLDSIKIQVSKDTNTIIKKTWLGIAYNT